MGAGAVLAPYGGQYTPLLAQAAGGAAVGIRLSGLSSAPTHTTVDQFTLEVSNLSAAAIYQVVVSSSNATALGLGGCGTASQTETVTGVTAQALRFVVYACALGDGTITAEVRPSGAAAAAATASQRLSVVAIPDEALTDARGAARNVARSGTPGIVSGIHFDGISTTSFWAKWSAPGDTGGVPLTRFQIEHWRHDPANPTSRNGLTATTVDSGTSRSKTLRELASNTEYAMKMRACNGPHNSNCSPWSADHRFTTIGGGTPPPPPGAFRFSATVAAQVYRAGQLVSVQLPAATGGAGHVTYRLSPAMGNGLSFDGPTRTIAGTPQQAAEQATYTYTATDTNNSRVQLSVPLTVFNVHLMTWHRDDGTYRRIADGAFVDAVYSRWSVLEYAGVEPREPITRAAGFRFQVRLPAHVGFQVGTTCTWPAAAPTATDILQTPWVAYGQAFAFVRCSVGSGRAATVELWVRDPGGAESLLETRRLGGQQAWHLADHVALYYVRGTDNRGAIRLVESARNAGDGLFPGLRPPNLDLTVTPNPLLGSSEQYAAAAGTWHAVDGVTFALATIRAQADVVIEGYWDTAPPNGDDDVCGQSIACMYLSGPYPHVELGRRLLIENPPHWGHESKPRMWVVNFEDAEENPGFNQYLPAVLEPEFGHAISLGHSNDPSDIMNGRVRRIGCTGTNCGLSTNDREGARALYTSPHHAAH